MHSKINHKDIIEYVTEVLKYRGDKTLLEQFLKWEIPRFPINGKTLKDAGVPAGKMYGPIINKLKNLWIESEYKLTADDLVQHIPTFIEEFELRKKEKNK